jgi:hypothetical protein
MYRRFDFEGAIHEILDCVPLVVRRKLDLVGLKISLAGWQKLPFEDRLALCHLPVDGAVDLDVYARVLRAFTSRIDVPLSDLTKSSPTEWTAERAIARIADRLPSHAVDAARVAALSEEERYAIVKLADPKREPHKLTLLLGELGL